MKKLLFVSVEETEKIRNFKKVTKKGLLPCYKEAKKSNALLITAIGGKPIVVKNFNKVLKPVIIKNRLIILDNNKKAIAGYEFNESKIIKFIKVIFNIIKDSISAAMPLFLLTASFMPLMICYCMIAEDEGYIRTLIFGLQILFICMVLFFMGVIISDMIYREIENFMSKNKFKIFKR